MTRNLRRTEPTEADTLRAICDFLDLQMAQGKLVYIRHNPSTVISNMVKGKIRTAFKKVRQSQLGAPDVIVLRTIKKRAGVSGDWYSELNVFCIETKSPTGKLSPTQKQWRERAEAQGCRYIVARSLEEAMEPLR